MMQVLRRARAALWIGLVSMSLAACDQLAAETEPTHQYVLQIDPERIPGDADIEGLNEATRDVLVRRIGGSDITIHKTVLTHTGQFVLDVSGANSSEMIKSAIGVTGEISFRTVEPDVPYDDLMRGIAPPGSEILPSSDGVPVAVRRLGRLRGHLITNALPGIDPNSNQPVINIQFDDEGTRKFASMSRENVGRPIAIVLDGEVLSTPIVNEPILGGALQVSGQFTWEEAEQLAIVLQTGTLPAPVILVEERELK